MRSSSRLSIGFRLLFGFVGFAFTHTVSAQSVPSMAEIGIELAEGQVLPLSKQINFELVSSNSNKLATNLENWEYNLDQQYSHQQRR